MVPTPVPHTPTTTGVVTYPATTVVLTEETTVCVPSTTSVPSGTHTLGGVTTIVTTATTVTCPYATVETSEGVTTSVIKTTEYVCPSSGTYTIAPTTTYVPQPTDVVIPSITNYPPGTYTAPEVVTTITDTKTVIYCPFEAVTPTSAAVPTTSAAPPTSVAAPPTSVAIPPISVAIPSVVIPTTTAAPAPEPTTAYPTSAPATSTASSSKPKPTGGNGGSLGGDTPGVPWGTTYTPYEPETGLCMSQKDVEEDIAALAAKGIKIVRTYSTDCNTLEYVGGACEKHGVQMMVGVFVDGSDGCSPNSPKISEQISSLKSWGKWDMVPLVNVGNEAIINGYCTAQQIATLIETCKSEFSGYTGLFTTAETVNIWQEPETQSALCGVVDILGTNAHAFFNYQTTADKAGEFVKSQLDIVSNLCSGKDGIVLETGWPSEGTSQGVAVAGIAEQAVAIDSIIKTCGEKAILFSLYDDMWKSGSTGCGNCEQHCKFLFPSLTSVYTLANYFQGVSPRSLTSASASVSRQCRCDRVNPVLPSLSVASPAGD